MGGTIIGAGVFAVPAAMRQSGILRGTIAFWIVALAILSIHLIYSEVVLRNKALGRERFPGQVRALLGSGLAKVAFITYPGQILGACLAYVLLGGGFVSILVNAFGVYLPDAGFHLLFWLGGALTVLFGISIVARVEVLMTLLLFILLVICSVLFLPLGTISAWLFAGSTSHVLAALGVFVFALFGLPVIPEIAALCEQDRGRTQQAIVIGSLGAAYLIWLFGAYAGAALPQGVLGHPQEIAALLPPLYWWLIPAIGLLAVATSFITLTQDLVTTLHIDAHCPPKWSLFLALIIPLALAFIVRDVLPTVGLVGAMFGGMNGCLAALMGLELPIARRSRLVTFICVLTAAIFLVIVLSRII